VVEATKERGEEGKETHVGDALKVSRDAQNPVVDTLNDLGDTSLDSGEFSKVGDVLSSLSDDDTGLLGRDESSKGEVLALLSVLSSLSGLVVVSVGLGGILTSGLAGGRVLGKGGGGCRGEREEKETKKEERLVSGGGHEGEARI